MVAVAKHRQNAKSGYPYRLDSENGSLVGVKHYEVLGASSFLELYAANGLPKIGDPFDDDHPDVRAKLIRPRSEPGQHGTWNVGVEYRTNDASSWGGVTPEPGLELTTTLNQVRSSENVNESVGENPEALTDNASGVPKMVNSLVFLITQYSTDVPGLPPIVFLSDSPKVNSKNIVLRNFMGVSGANIPVEAGQLLYAGFGLGIESGLFFVRHELHLRRSWKYLKYDRDVNNSIIYPPRELDLYETADFVGVLGSAG